MPLKYRTLMLAIGLALTVALAGPAHARQTKETPNTSLAVLDALAARPMGVAATVVGGAVLLVSLPFTIWSDFEGATEALVGKPFRFTFQRQLGNFNRDWDDAEWEE